MNNILATIGWWALWLLTFLGFPVGGGLAYLLLKAVDGPLKGLVAGAIAGAFIGLAQWLVLRQRIPLEWWWIALTSAGLAAGLSISVAVFGINTSDWTFIVRAVIVGLMVGLAQWFLLRQYSPLALIWVLTIVVAWSLGWLISRTAGVDLSYSWAVFGSTGAIVFAALTGLIMLWLLRA